MTLAHPASAAVGALAAVADELVPGVTRGVLARLDIPALVREFVDIDRLAAMLDVEAVIARVDLDAVVAKVDIGAVLDRLDLDAVVARVDIDAVLDRLDLDAVAARLDLDSLVEKVDIGRVLDRVDVDAVVAKVDLDASWPGRPGPRRRPGGRRPGHRPDRHRRTRPLRRRRDRPARPPARLDGFGHHGDGAQRARPGSRRGPGRRAAGRPPPAPPGAPHRRRHPRDTDGGRPVTSADERSMTSTPYPWQQAAPSAGVEARPPAAVPGSRAGMVTRSLANVADLVVVVVVVIGGYARRRGDPVPAESVDVPLPRGVPGDAADRRVVRPGG